MLTVKAIKENGHEDIFCCHAVRTFKDSVALDTYGAETQMGNSYEQTLWLEKLPRPQFDYNGVVYTVIYVSCGGQTIGTYRPSPCSADETDKVPDTAKAA